MWIALVFISFVIVCLILGTIKENSEKTIKCKYCGHEFGHSESGVVDYKLNGKLQITQCPRCKTYINVDP